MATDGDKVGDSRRSANLAVAALIVAALALAAALMPRRGPLNVPSLTVRDERGRDRIVMEARDGVARVALRDGRGIVRAWVVVSKDGVPAVATMPGNSPVRADLAGADRAGE